MKNQHRKSSLSKVYDAITPSMYPTTTTIQVMGNSSSENQSLISSLTIFTSLRINNNVDDPLIFDISLDIILCIIYPSSFLHMHIQSTHAHIYILIALHNGCCCHLNKSSFSSHNHMHLLSNPFLASHSAYNGSK